MALGPGSNNFLLGVLLATLVALGVLAYLYYERTRPVAKIDLPGVSGEITKEGVNIEVGKPKNWPAPFLLPKEFFDADPPKLIITADDLRTYLSLASQARPLVPSGTATLMGLGLSCWALICFRTEAPKSRVEGALQAFVSIEEKGPLATLPRGVNPWGVFCEVFSTTHSGIALSKIPARLSSYKTPSDKAYIWFRPSSASSLPKKKGQEVSLPPQRHS
jgi:hypothetical protein